MFLSENGSFKNYYIWEQNKRKQTTFDEQKVVFMRKIMHTSRSSF
jgi:hypothetical protein